MFLGLSGMGDNLGDRIRQTRIVKGMSFRDLAMESGLTTVNICNLETGKATASLLIMIPTARDINICIVQTVY